MEPKILIMDIEASNLAANFGIVFCIGYKWLGEKKVHMLSIRDDLRALKKDPTADKGVVERFRPILGKADIVVHHYGNRFDIPFLQTRALENGMPPLPEPTSIDMWRIAKYRLKLNSNRLASLSSMLGTKSEKTPIDNKSWIRALSGHVPSIKAIEHHCHMDILVTEEVFLKIRPFAANLPSVARLMNRAGCPACGAMDVQKYGLRATNQGVRQRWMCNECGHNYYTAKKGA